MTATDSNRLLIPDSWGKVTFSQFMRIKPGMRVTELLSILLEKPEEEVMTMHMDLEQAFKTMAFLDEPIPQTVAAELNLEALSIGQYEDMRLYVKQLKGTAEDFQHYPVIYATYWQNPYDGETVDELIKYVNMKPCGLVLGTVQYYLKEMERIEAKWAPLFPKEGYSQEQQAAGFPQLAEYFGHFGSLIFAERNSRWSRDEWSKKSVTEFKYFMLYLSREQQAQKKYSEGQALRMKTAKKK